MYNFLPKQYKNTKNLDINHNYLSKLIVKYFNNKKKLQGKINKGYKSLKRFNFQKNCFEYYKVITKYIND